MPLTELTDYFNDHLQSEIISKKLPGAAFYMLNNRYWARFGRWILGTQFHLISAINRSSSQIYEAELCVRSTTAIDQPLTREGIFNSLEDSNQIVYLDRLVRTLHSLNYLQQFKTHEHILSLEVHPRHILGVAEDHGATFEAILTEVGLSSERVLLHAQLPDEANLQHFSNAFSQYKQHGYRIGVNLTQINDLELTAQFGIHLDAVFFCEDSLGKTSASRVQRKPRYKMSWKDQLLSQSSWIAEDIFLLNFSENRRA